MGWLKVIGVLTLLVFLFQTIAGLFLYGSGNDGGLVLTTAGLIVCLFLIPNVFGIVPFDPFSPLSLATVAAVLGTGLRVPYILFSGEARAEFLMFESNFDAAESHMTWICIGVAAFVIGYCVINRRLSMAWVPMARTDLMFSRRVLIISALFALAGGAAAMVFIRNSGFDLGGGLASASRKTFVLHEAADGQKFASTGGLLRFMVVFAEIPLLVLLGLLIVKRLRWTLNLTLLVLLLCIPVFLVPFLTSSRSPIVLVFLNIAIVAFYFRKLKLHHLLIGVLISGLIVVVMGNLRNQNMDGGMDQRSIAGTFVGSGNGLDIIRTAAIIDRVPENVDYLYGWSYLSLVTFYVPRSVWPEKPSVALGPWVKREVFGEPVPGNNGWPSGMIAEAYVNFGLLLIPVVMMLFGMFLRLIYNSFRPYLGVSLVITILYALLAWRLGFDGIGLNFAHVMSSILVVVIPYLLYLYLLSGAHVVRRSRQ
jgi:oligosaccharide repeat unit polymerase